MEALFNDAQKSFTQGLFDVALQKVGAIHTKTSNKDYEMVMFLEAACHYNLKQYDKAIEFFSKFITTFPQSPNLNDAKLNLGQAYLDKGDGEKAVSSLKEAAAVPTLRDKAGMMLAYHYRRSNQLDEAVNILQVVIGGLNGVPTQEQQQAILMAAEIFVSKGDTEKASAMMDKLKSGSSADESIVQLNILSQKVGDAMLEQQRYGEALIAYQNMRRKAELIRIQTERVAKIQSWLAPIAAGQSVMFMGRKLSSEDAQNLLDVNRKILEEVEGIKDYDASIYYRLGQCFYEMKRYYESILAFKRIYDEHPEYADRDRVLFGMIVCNAALERNNRAYQLCEKYMEEFPSGANIAQVTDMFGLLAYQSGNIEAAIKSFKRALTTKGADKQRLNYLLGIVLFEAQYFDESRLTFQALLAEDKNSAYKDDAEYRIALTYFFQNNSKEAKRKLRDYVAGNPKGAYVIDAKYRIAFIEFQGANTGQGGSKAEAQSQLEALTREAPNDQNIGQVWSLLGDIYAQLATEEGKGDYIDRALDAYRAAVDKAKTPDVLNYAIDAATNLMTEKAMWAPLAEMWTNYYNTNKGGPLELKAIYQIATARQRLASQLKQDGNLAEYEKQTQAARELIAKATIPHLGNPGNEQVEVLIQQLVTMIVPKMKKRAAAKVDAAAPVDASKPATPAVPAPVEMTSAEVEEIFKKLLTPEGDGQTMNGTAAARILYGRALISRLMRDAAKYENLMGVIPDAATTEELSPLLLALLGEMSFKKNNKEKAAEYFGLLREKYPNSEFADKAPVGLAEIEFEKKEYQKALDLFNEAIEKYAASSSILDATLGKAKSLLALAAISKKAEDYKKAGDLYKTIAATPDWRSAVSLAMLGLAQVEDGNTRYKEAVGYYQRIILAYRKDKPTLAKAYLLSAKAFLNMGDNASAKTVLQEMLRTQDLQSFPEFTEAQQILARTSG
jgi:tetratricopeptide (TPR) repeat protein